MSYKFLSRDFPEVDSEKFEMPNNGRLHVVLFLATHGLWLFMSLTGLVLSVVDAKSTHSAILLADTALER